jgi:hypothetical protein
LNLKERIEQARRHADERERAVRELRRQLTTQEQAALEKEYQAAEKLAEVRMGSTPADLRDAPVAQGKAGGGGACVGNSLS